MIYTHVLNCGGRGVRSPLDIPADMGGSVPVLERRAPVPALPDPLSAVPPVERSSATPFTPRLPKGYHALAIAAGRGNRGRRDP